MLVVVRRKRRKNGDWYFVPVDSESFSLLWDATMCGWFYASQWDKTLTLLRRWFGDVKLTNRWYHIQRCRETGFD